MSRLWKGSQQLEGLLVNVDELHEDPINAMGHPERNLEVLKGSLNDFGQLKTIVANPDGKVIAGNATLRMARELGWTHIAVARFDGSLKDALRYGVIDNKSAMLAEWDQDGFAATLDALRQEDPSFDVGSVGFSDDEVHKILGTGDYEKREDEDDAPPLPAVAVSKLGDVWLLADHRLTCGDSTKEETVALAMGGHKPNIMTTDSPYGVEYDPSWRNAIAISRGVSIKGAANGKVKNDDKLDWTEAFKLFKGNVAYTWFASQWCGLAQMSIEDAGFETRATIIWKKVKPMISRGHYHWAHEMAFYSVRAGKTANWLGDRKQSTVWDVDHIKSETGHGTQKPVELFRRPILNHTKEGDYVFDPFVGSGTALVACELTGRKCIAIDLDPLYVDVAVLRWQGISGKPAIRESDGKTFDELRGQVDDAA